MTESELDLALDNFVLEFEKKNHILKNERESIKKDREALKQKYDELSDLHNGKQIHDNDVLDINAGGVNFRVTRGTLTQINGSCLEALFSGRWENQILRDSDDRIFLDINPVCFKIIIKYLDELKMSSVDDPPDFPCLEDEEELNFLDGLLHVFGLDDLRAPVIQKIDSLIMKDNDDLRCLERFFQEEKDFPDEGGLELVYRATRDGWEGRNFHEKCDNHKNTLVVFRCFGGFVLGGFTNVPWTGIGGYKHSSKSFLFSLNCHSGLKPTKMKIKSGREQCAVVHNASYGPIFGSGHDICMYSGGNKRITFNVGDTYECPSGQNGQTFLTGSQSSKLEEVEVFHIVHHGKSCIFQKSKDGTKQQLPFEKVTFDEFPVQVQQAAKKEQQDLTNARNELINLEQKFEKEKMIVDIFCNKDEAQQDIVTLDVGGTHIMTRLSTLCQMSDSVLAKKFSDPNCFQQGNDISSKQLKSHELIKLTLKVCLMLQDVPKEFFDELKKNKIEIEELISSLLVNDDEKYLIKMGIIESKNKESLEKMMKCINEMKSKKEKCVFLGHHDDYCFGKILDYLRLRSMMKVSGESPLAAPHIRECESKNFKRMVKYYFPGNESEFLDERKEW